ncbi:RNA exonuclease 1 homolog [Ixodes scapularis]
MGRRSRKWVVLAVPRGTLRPSQGWTSETRVRGARKKRPVRAVLLERRNRRASSAGSALSVLIRTILISNVNRGATRRARSRSRPGRKGGSAEAPIPRIHQPAAAARERDPRGARREPGWMRKIRSRVPRKPRLHRRTTSGVRPDGKDIGGRGSPRSAFSVLVRTFLMKGSFGNLEKASLAEGSCRRDWDTEIPRIFIPRKYLRTAVAKARGLAATRKS